MKTYEQLKEQARQKAINWQLDSQNYNCSYMELSIIQDYFTKLGKRYGLLSEFAENGII